MEKLKQRLTVQEAAQEATCDGATILRLIASGQLVAINISPNPNALRACWRIDRQELERFLDSRRSSRQPAAAK